MLNSFLGRLAFKVATLTNNARLSLLGASTSEVYFVIRQQIRYDVGPLKSYEAAIFDAYVTAQAAIPGHRNVNTPAS